MTKYTELTLAVIPPVGYEESWSSELKSSFTCHAAMAHVIYESLRHGSPFFKSIFDLLFGRLKTSYRVNGALKRFKVVSRDEYESSRALDS